MLCKSSLILLWLFVYCFIDVFLCWVFIKVIKEIGIFLFVEGKYNILRVDIDRSSWW